MMFRMVDSPPVQSPVTKLDGGPSHLHSEDDDTIVWLTKYDGK